LIKNLENNQGLYDLIYRVLIESEVIAFNTHAPLMRLGAMYVFLKKAKTNFVFITEYMSRLYTITWRRGEAKRDELGATLISATNFLTTTAT
jgi:hypothetical protein